jgi:primosomal protein N' (replication factor Y)
MQYRRQLGYPPFTKLVRLEYRHAQNSRAQAAAQEMAGRINTWLHKQDHRATRMIGPAPCFFARVGGQFRWQIILRGPDPASILRGRTLEDWRVEVNPISLL